MWQLQPHTAPSATSDWMAWNALTTGGAPPAWLMLNKRETGHKAGGTTNAPGEVTLVQWGSTCTTRDPGQEQYSTRSKQAVHVANAPQPCAKATDQKLGFQMTAGALGQRARGLAAHTAVNQ